MNGLVDATKPLVITIKEADRYAIQCSPRFCVIANAIHRLRGVEDQRVGAVTVRIKRGGVWYRYDIDQSTRGMIRAYDLDGQVMPAGVKIILNPPRNPLGWRNGKNSSGSNNRSNNMDNVQTRRPSSRHISTEPIVKKVGRK